MLRRSFSNCPNSSHNQKNPILMAKVEGFQLFRREIIDYAQIHMSHEVTDIRRKTKGKGFVVKVKYKGATRIFETRNVVVAAGYLTGQLAAKVELMDCQSNPWFGLMFLFSLRKGRCIVSLSHHKRVWHVRCHTLMLILSLSHPFLSHPFWAGSFRRLRNFMFIRLCPGQNAFCHTLLVTPFWKWSRKLWADVVCQTS